jgi:uncharacterized membrane protein
MTAAATQTTFGPVQMLVVGFEENEFKGEILPELRRLKEHEIIRLIDLLVVTKDEKGNLAVVQQSDLSRDEAMRFGAIAGALIGFGAGGEEEAEVAAVRGAAALEDGHVFDDHEVWYLADAIPSGSSAAIALIEHRWAIPLRDAIRNAGGVALADEWIHPADLVAVGLKAAAQEGTATAEAG